jgi:hypothetical protein
MKIGKGARFTVALGATHDRVSAVSFVVLLISILCGAEGRIGLILTAAHAETAASSLAAQLRRQGHACDRALSAVRDRSRSKPDEAVWVVRCGNATYRLRLIPHQAARVERL